MLLTKEIRMFVSLFRSNRIRDALDEGLDFHDVIVLQLAGEVGHPLPDKWSFKHDILEVGDHLGRGVTKVFDVAALVNVRHAVTVSATTDVERLSFWHVLGIIFDASQQTPDLVFREFRQRALATDHKGVDPARPLPVGCPTADAVHAAPPHGNRHVLYAIHHVSRGAGDRSGPYRRLPEFFTGLGVIGNETTISCALENKIS